MSEAASPFDDEEEDFDFHDTIPAPPWNEDELDALEDPVVPPR